MTCHLGHYLGLVILDIIYDLPSWTFYMTCHPGHYICVQLRSWVQKVLHIPIKIKVVVFYFKLYKYIV